MAKKTGRSGKTRSESRKGPPEADLTEWFRSQKDIQRLIEHAEREQEDGRLHRPPFLTYDQDEFHESTTEVLVRIAGQECLCDATPSAGIPPEEGEDGAPTGFLMFDVEIPCWFLRDVLGKPPES